MRLLNKNIVKKSLVVLLVFICYIFASCSNSLDSTPSATGSYSVTGKISFAGSSGAAPLILTKDLEGRTATTSFNNAHFSLNLYAYKYGQDGLDQSKKYDNVVVDQSGSFIFCFESKGEYVIYAELIKDEKTCGKGSAYVDVNSFTPKSVRINASPVITENGTIQLDVSTATDITPTIKKVCVNWIDIYSRNIEDEANHDGIGHESSPAMQIMNSVLTEGEYNKSFDVVNGTTTISYDDFPGGSWLAKISFDDENGNTLYSCQEIINVYPGFITNLWYGTTPAITDGSFKVTKNMVTKYGTEVVPNFDKILLWKYDPYVPEDPMLPTNGEEKYSYYLVDSNSVSQPVTTSSILTRDTMYGIKDLYSFDSEGNLYLMQPIDDYFTSCALESTKSNWQAPLLSTLGITSSDVSFNFVKAFAIDYKTNKAYLLKETASGGGSSSGSGIHQVLCYSQLISSDGANVEYETIGLSPTVTTSDNFIVNNGIIYWLTGSGTSYSLKIFDTSEATPLSVKKEIPINPVSILGINSLPDSAMITDMLYQDGAIYLLYKETGTYISRGAVLRYNTATGYIDSLGLAGAIDNESLAGVKVSTYVWDGNSGTNKPLYNDEDCTSRWYVDADKVWFSTEIYSPISFDSLSTCQFYGPSKFVAIKPKKLVIADDGIAFYTDNDVLKYKNVNRVVTVDLERFAIENTEGTSVTFNSDKSGMIEIGDTGLTVYQDAVADEVDEDHKKYYGSATNEYLDSVDGTSVVFAIPCGD